MSTRFAKFAPDNEAAANTLSDFLDQQLATINADALVPWAARDPNGKLRVDSNGNWVVAWPYDGPFLFAGNIIPKPDGMDELMTSGIIVDSPDWPNIDE